MQHLGLKREQFQLAKEMLEVVPPSTPRYDELVIAYNNSRPNGYRALGPDGPKKGKSKKGKSKNKRRKKRR